MEPNKIAETETDNYEDSEKKRKILDWTELYNSVLTNIQVASQKLSDIFIRIEDKSKNLNSLNNDILKVSAELVESKAEKEYILRQINDEKKSFENDKSLFQKDKDNILKQLYNKGRDIEKEEIRINGSEKSVRDKVILKENNIKELNSQIENKKLDIARLEQKSSSVKDKILLLEKDKDNIEYDINKITENKSLLLKDKDEIEKDIFKKQRSLDSFKENKLKMEQDLSRKTKDLQILEGRLRKQFKEIGQDFIL